MLANQKEVEAYVTFTQNSDGTFVPWFWTAVPMDVGKVFRIRIPIPKELLPPVIEVELPDQPPPPPENVRGI